MFWVYQPLLPFGGAVAEALIVGGVLSMLTLTTLLGPLVLPAWSVTNCTVDETAAPSLLNN